MIATKKLKGSHKALLERKKARLSLKLNRPIRGMRGLANLAAELRRQWGGKDHPPDWEQIKKGKK